MRLPIRARLTVWYTAVLAGIVAMLVPFVVLQFRSDMRAGVDRDVRRTWSSLAHQYAVDGLLDYSSYTHALLPRGGVSQVFDPGARLLATGGDGVPQEAIASRRDRAAALAGAQRLTTVALGADPEPYRMLVAPVDRLGERHVLALAEPLEPIEDSVQRVMTLLLIAVPAGLAIAALGGWWLARKALLPVRRMSSNAARIGIDELGERIAVPRPADELAHLAVTLNGMLDRLERGVAEKQRLVADASHDLRSPLAVMRAELDVSLRGDVAGPAREVLQSVREEVARMSRTVDNLLTLAQTDEGELKLLRTRLDLGAQAAAAVAALAPAAAAKGLELETEDGLGEGRPGVVQADQHRVHQALVNVVENAIKYTPSGGRVTVRTWHRGDEIGVTVSDTGPGIPREALGQVFDRFFRVDSARGRTSGGSGLGLAICREIAEAHGGRVWVESEEGNGSAFSLAFPAAPQPVVPRRGSQNIATGA